MKAYIIVIKGMCGLWAGAIEAKNDLHPLDTVYFGSKTSQHSAKVIRARGRFAYAGFHCCEFCYGTMPQCLEAEKTFMENLGFYLEVPTDYTEVEK